MTTVACFWRGGGGGGRMRTLGEALQGPVRGAEVAVERVREGGVGGGDDRRGGGEGDGRGARARERRRFVAIERGGRGRRRVVLPGERGRGEGAARGGGRARARRRGGAKDARRRERGHRERVEAVPRGGGAEPSGENPGLLSEISSGDRGASSFKGRNPRPFKSRLQKVFFFRFDDPRLWDLNPRPLLLFPFDDAMRWDLNPRPFRLRFDSHGLGLDDGFERVVARASHSSSHAASFARRARRSRSARARRGRTRDVVVLDLAEPPLAPLEVSGVRQGRAQGAHPGPRRFVLGEGRGRRGGRLRGPRRARRALRRRGTRPARTATERLGGGRTRRNGVGVRDGGWDGEGGGVGDERRGVQPRERVREASRLARPRRRSSIVPGRGGAVRGRAALQRRGGVDGGGPRAEPLRGAPQRPRSPRRRRSRVDARGGMAQSERGVLRLRRGGRSPDGTAQRLGHAPVPAARIQTESGTAERRGAPSFAVRRRVFRDAGTLEEDEARVSGFSDGSGRGGGCGCFGGGCGCFGARGRRDIPLPASGDEREPPRVRDLPAAVRRRDGGDAARAVAVPARAAVRGVRDSRLADAQGEAAVSLVQVQGGNTPEAVQAVPVRAEGGGAAFDRPRETVVPDVFFKKSVRSVRRVARRAPRARPSA